LYSSGSAHGPVTGYCEYGNELSGSVKVKFLGFSRILLHWFSSPISPPGAMMCEDILESRSRPT